MKSKKTLDERIGNFRTILEVTDDASGKHDYGISDRAWTRGVRFMNHFGPQRALELIDQRAERAADRRDYETARRWRTLIVAIHAIMDDEIMPGESAH